MDASDIIRLLTTDHYAPANLEEVNNLCKNYPQFSLAHMLKVRILESLGYEKEDALRVAAVYSSDRERLFRLVTEVTQPLQAEPEPDITGDREEGIVFSDEAGREAEVIIEQHAPYAGSVPQGDLLELDEESSADTFILDSEPPSENLSEGVDNNSLINSFIKDDPGPIRADRKTSLKGDASLDSIKEHDGFITDTLARIYVKQGLYAKAIYAYERLSLKYPEKSAYFAAQIEKIQNINHS